MKRAVRIIISGKVQDVFFRKFIKEHSDRLELKGYAKNNNDGVEAWLEGDSESINKMIELCKKGPRDAIVEKTEVIDENVNNFKNFKILY